MSRNRHTLHPSLCICWGEKQALSVLVYWFRWQTIGQFKEDWSKASMFVSILWWFMWETASANSNYCFIGKAFNIVNFTWWQCNVTVWNNKPYRNLLGVSIARCQIRGACSSLSTHLQLTDIQRNVGKPNLQILLDCFVIFCFYLLLVAFNPAVYANKAHIFFQELEKYFAF